ncbi:MAG TPA: HDOD domain-containing protein [Burkholderiales bacterium]|nr:HDOD domain-containing protein [Burkholderiales bacterium]
MTNEVTIDGVEIALPARPGVLAELSTELEAEEPDFGKVSALVNSDLGLAAEVVRTANSPYFGVSGRIASVRQAINFLGLSQVFNLVTEVMLRRVFPANDPLMDALWDTSTKRAGLMARLARNTSVPVERAYTAGLFADCGVAVLAELVPNYRLTWQRTRWLPDAPWIERLEHLIDHPAVSASLVEQWGLPEEIAQAVRLHHDIGGLDAPPVPARTRSLVALSVLANFVLVQALSQDASLWEAPFSKACAILDVPLMVAQTWAEQASSLLESPC